MTFQEPKYEELLAYRGSTSRFRRWFGPIIMSARESMAVMLILFALIFTEATGGPSFLLEALLSGLIAYGLSRLYMRHHRFEKCLANLKTIFSDATLADAVIYRLTDYEISLFAKSSRQEILQYVHQQKSLRWRLLILAYFSKAI